MNIYVLVTTFDGGLDVLDVIKTNTLEDAIEMLIDNSKNSLKKAFLSYAQDSPKLTITNVIKFLKGEIHGNQNSDYFELLIFKEDSWQYLPFANCPYKQKN